MPSNGAMPLRNMTLVSNSAKMTKKPLNGLTTHAQQLWFAAFALYLA